MDKKREKKQRTFHVWRRYSSGLDWLSTTNISADHKRKITAACYLAYMCGRKHERTDSVETSRTDDERTREIVRRELVRLGVVVDKSPSNAG